MANTTGRKPRKEVAHTDSPSSYALLLSGCTNYAFYVFHARRNRRNSPSMARFLLASASMPRHFCALQHNSTDTKQLRYSPTRQHRLPPPPTSATYAEIQCAGPLLRFGRHGALSLHVGSSKAPLLPTRHN